MNRLTASISYRFIRVWQRNVTVYAKIWEINFLPPLLEPCFYLLAFGVGLSALVGDLHYHGEKVSYVRYIAPALISVAIMYNAFFETTYSSFVRMYFQKTFDAMMATPLFLSEIISGEIVWGTTKALIAAAIMMVVVTLFGLISYPSGLLIIPAALIGGLAFASIGMFFTGIVKTIDMFNLPIFLFITPMFLFSGTFFPIDTLPGWAQMLALVFPLTHLVEIVRAACFGMVRWGLLWNCAYLILFSCVFFPLALRVMNRRLIK
jgi:lipooligosaccharide transport system permease protein